MKIVVVGASGFIGRAFVEVAARAGHSVVAGVRNPGRTKLGADVSLAQIEATNATSLAKVFDGSDVVVDCIMGSPATMVGAADAICKAAREQGVKRVVQMSSVAVYGASSGLIGEERDVAATDAYGQAKIDCERIADESRDRGLDVVTLRPALVYGPASPLWVTRIARMLRAGRLGDLGEMGDGYCNLIHVRAVTEAMLLAAQRRDLVHRLYNLAPSEPPTWNRYLMNFARRLGAIPVRRIGRRRMNTERVLFAPVLRVGQVLTRRVQLEQLIPPPITPGLARLFGARVRYDASRSRDFLVKGEIRWEQEVEVIAAGLQSEGAI